MVLLGAEVGLRPGEMRQLTSADVMVEGRLTGLRIPWSDAMNQGGRRVMLVSGALGSFLQSVVAQRYSGSQPLLKGSSTHLENRFRNLLQRSGVWDQEGRQRGLLSLRVTAGARQLLWGQSQILDVRSRSSMRI